MSVGAFLSHSFRALTQGPVDQTAGIAIQSDQVRPGYVRFLRTWNLIEPTLLLVLYLWLIIYGSAYLPKHTIFLYIMLPLAVWAFVLSPLVHYPFERNVFLQKSQRSLSYYYFECRGLGNPFRYFLPHKGEYPYLIKYFQYILGIISGVTILYFICQWSVAKGLQHYGTPWYSNGSISKGLFLTLPQYGWFVLGLIFLWFPLVLRLDNLRQCGSYLLICLGVMLGYLIISEVLFFSSESWLRPLLEPYKSFRLAGNSTASRLSDTSLILIASQWAGYAFFGCWQQILFSSIFAVYYSRAFDVEHSPRGRFLACLLSGLVFGLFHYPNFFLGLLTFTGGFIGSYFFLQCRNIFIFGAAHGLIGAMANKLLPISFSTDIAHFIP